MQDILLQQGIDLMLFGMGTVFVFLSLLVLTTQAMSFLVQRFFPDPDPISPNTGSAVAGISDSKLLVIIKAAIDQHRGKK